MTAMADVAFLLLFFFLFCARFRPEDSVTVEPPVSHNHDGACDINEPSGMLIYVKNNKVYLDITDAEVKRQTLQNIAQQYNVRLTNQELHKFMNIGNFGSPMHQLGAAVRHYKPYPNGIVTEGVPIDYTRNNEFSNWLRETRSIFKQKHGHDLRISIVADANQTYPIMKLVIENLQYQQINKFSLTLQRERAPVYAD
ncbi:biopolymer transporter ExbD [Mucilaginibacter sp. Bleaf8]|nr:biopolymer transporter ExbD [Mucilaginibacter sp. Bleaf8]